MSVAKKVVVIGGGFGGLRTVKSLRHADVEVTLIDRSNHHLFQPLLYQVATGDLSPANIAAPLRYLFRNQRNCTTLMAEVTDIDIDKKQVVMNDLCVPYDYLVLATGATHSYFGNDQWEKYAPGLKTIDGATEIRSRILGAFEAAEREPDPAKRAAWMTFVIVGAGPTGVELAGALSDVAYHSLKHDFRNINPNDTRIILIEGGHKPLHMYPDDLSQHALKSLNDLKVDLRIDTTVTDICEGYVSTQSAGVTNRIESNTVIWAAGVAASPLARQLAEKCGASTARAGQIAVGPDLTVPNHPEIMVIGDCSSFQGPGGRPLPGLAPVAMQQGDYVGKRITALISGCTFERPFSYRDRGSMAVIGRFQAVALIGNRHLKGLPAWFVWLVIHLMEITLFSNRLLVMIQWGVTFFLRRRSARLITRGHELTPHIPRN